MATYYLHLRKFAVIASLSMACLACLPIQSALAEPAKPMISVNGTGSATATPDMAMITLGVQRQAKSARKALSKNNKAMTAVLAALKGEGIADKDLQT